MVECVDRNTNSNRRRRHRRLSDSVADPKTLHGGRIRRTPEARGLGAQKKIDMARKRLSSPLSAKLGVFSQKRKTSKLRAKIAEKESSWVHSFVLFELNEHRLWGIASVASYMDPPRGRTVWAYRCDADDGSWLVDRRTSGDYCCQHATSCMATLQSAAARECNNFVFSLRTIAHSECRCCH